MRNLFLSTCLIFVGLTSCGVPSVATTDAMAETLHDASDDGLVAVEPDLAWPADMNVNIVMDMATVDMAAAVDMARDLSVVPVPSDMSLPRDLAQLPDLFGHCGSLNEPCCNGISGCELLLVCRCTGFGTNCHCK